MIRVKITVTTEPGGMSAGPRKVEFHQYEDSFVPAINDLESGREFFNNLVANLGLHKNGAQKRG